MWMLRQRHRGSVARWRPSTYTPAASSRPPPSRWRPDLRRARIEVPRWLKSACDLRRQAELTPREWVVLLRDFPAWRDCRSSSSAMDARLPWVTSPAIRRLRELVREGDRAVEWGAGGSTLFLLDNGMHVTTVEHDQDWLELTRTRLSQQAARRWNPVLAVPTARDPNQAWDPSDWRMAHSSDSDAHDFTNYCQAPDPDPDVTLVLIDGRSRPRCLAFASDAFPRAVLVLDQTERAHYAPAMRYASGVRGRPRHYPGSIRGCDHLSRTSVWPPRSEKTA